MTASGMLVDSEAEYRLLGALIDLPEYIFKITEELFYGERIRIFRAMCDSFRHYGFITQEGLERFLGGPVPPQVEMGRGARPDPIIDKLKLLATKRQLAEMQLKIDKFINDPNPHPEEIKQALLFRPIMSQEDTTLRPGIIEFLSEFNRKRNGQYKFAHTGIKFLDEMLGGEWPKKAVTVVLGQGGGGKTALVCDSMLKMAMMQSPIASYFRSIEMSKEQIVQRLAVNLKKLNGNDVRKATLSDAEVKILNQGTEEIQDLPMFIDDTKDTTVEDIALQMRFHKERYGVDVTFVDYLQIINVANSMRGDNMSEALGNVVTKLKAAAHETDSSVVVLAQQNRGHTGMDSIYGSVRVAQAADVVLEIRMDVSALTEDTRMCTFEIWKNRNGPLGSQTTIFYPKYMRYEV